MSGDRLARHDHRAPRMRRPRLVDDWSFRGSRRTRSCRTGPRRRPARCPPCVAREAAARATTRGPRARAGVARGRDGLGRPRGAVRRAMLGAARRAARRRRARPGSSTSRGRDRGRTTTSVDEAPRPPPAARTSATRRTHRGRTALAGRAARTDVRRSPAVARSRHDGRRPGAVVLDRLRRSTRAHGGPGRWSSSSSPPARPTAGCASAGAAPAAALGLVAVPVAQGRGLQQGHRRDPARHRACS